MAYLDDNAISVADDIINHYFSYYQDSFNFKSTSFNLKDDASTQKKVQDIINSFGVKGRAIGSTTGPVVQKVFFQPDDGVKIEAVEALSRNIALKLHVESIKCSDYPELGAVAIEIPVKDRVTVPFGNVFMAEHQPAELPAAIGVDTDGNPVYIDIAKTPHMLIAGQTGSGKSVGVNSIILSLILKVKPDNLRLILIDPKSVEFTPYRNLPHLIGNHVITKPDEALKAMQWLVDEMEARYDILAKVGARNIVEFNNKVLSGNFSSFEKGQARHLPYIVTVIDEFADLMMTASATLNECVMRIAQKARAVGIHLILATQRPSVKVVTGDIQANIPTKIAFKVAKPVDSNIILGAAGAEKLLGNGDMILAEANGKTRRLHGAYLPSEEIDSAIETILDCGYTDNPYIGLGAMKVNFDEYLNPRLVMKNISISEVPDAVALYKKFKRGLGVDDMEDGIMWPCIWPNNPDPEKVAEILGTDHETSVALARGFLAAEELIAS